MIKDIFISATIAARLETALLGPHLELLATASQKKGTPHPQKSQPYPGFLISDRARLNATQPVTYWQMWTSG